MCEIDEYATSFFRSVCTSASAAPYTIEMTASTAISGSERLEPLRAAARARVAGSRSEPILSSTPASSTETAVGASTCASGSHVCSGKIGTLTASPTAIAMKIAVCTPAGSRGDLAAISSMSNVCARRSRGTAR